MWTKGLDPRRIAKLCRVPYRKVYDHIRTRVNHNPALFGQRLMLHDHPRLPPGGIGTRRPTWQERVAQLAQFQQTYGRFPRGYMDEEKSLYSFLQYQRERYRGGKLPRPQKSYLDEHLTGWLTLPKQEGENALWERRATELEKFLRYRDGYPSYKAASDPTERVLATWVTEQRRRHRMGKLSTLRKERLDELAPGWFVDSP